MPILWINEQAVAAENNDTILKAAQKAGIYIPTSASIRTYPRGKGVNQLSLCIRATRA
jgi:hypothetical protein